MTDDRRPKRVRMYQRARRNAPPRGVPNVLVAVDEDLTPPPQEPPTPAMLAEKPIELQLELLADALGSLHEKFGTVWDQRDNADRIEKLDARLDQLAQSVNAWAAEAVRHNEQIKALSTSIGAVVAFSEGMRSSVSAQSAQLAQFFEREWPRHEALMDRFGKALEDIAGRITRLEQAVQQLSSSDQALAARITAIETNTDALGIRVAALERKGHERELVKSTEAATNQKWFTWARAAGVGVFGLVTAVASNLGTIADWFR